MQALEKFLHSRFGILIAATAIAIPFGYFVGQTSINQSELATVRTNIEQVAAVNKPPVVLISTGLADISGNKVRMRFVAKREYNCLLTATTQWRDSEGVITSKHNPNKAILGINEKAPITLVDDIPSFLFDGDYDVRSVAEYDCGSGRTFVIFLAWRPVTLNRGRPRP